MSKEYLRGRILGKRVRQKEQNMFSLIKKTWNWVVDFADIIYEMRKARGYKGYYY